jgi:hypothetical protein
MLNKTKIALAAALVIGTASTALTAGHVVPGSMDGVNPAYHPRWFPNYPGVYNAPMGDPNAFPPRFNAAGQWYWPSSNACTDSNAYAFAPSAIHKHHRSAR